MIVNFSINEGKEFPYHAEYIGYATPPVNPNQGMGGISGHSRRSYGELLESVVNDLIFCPEDIQPIFSNDINEDLQNATKTALELLVRYNASVSKLMKISQVLSQ